MVLYDEVYIGGTVEEGGAGGERVRAVMASIDPT